MQNPGAEDRNPQHRIQNPILSWPAIRPVDKLLAGDFSSNFCAIFDWSLFLAPFYNALDLFLCVHF